MESVWSVSKLSTESVGSRRELVANSVHTADTTQLHSWVASASAVCIGHYVKVICYDCSLLWQHHLLATSVWIYKDLQTLNFGSRQPYLQNCWTRRKESTTWSARRLLMPTWVEAVEPAGIHRSLMRLPQLEVNVYRSSSFGPKQQDAEYGGIQRPTFSTIHTILLFTTPHFLHDTTLLFNRSVARGVINLGKSVMCKCGVVHTTILSFLQFAPHFFLHLTTSHLIHLTTPQFYRSSSTPRDTSVEKKCGVVQKSVV